MQTTKIIWRDGCQWVEMPSGFWMPGKTALIARVGEVIVIAPLSDTSARVARSPRPGSPGPAPAERRLWAGFAWPGSGDDRALEIRSAFAQPPANDNEPVKDTARLLFAA